jgi:hypothetical protein
MKKFSNSKDIRMWRRPTPPNKVSIAAIIPPYCFTSLQPHLNDQHLWPRVSPESRLRLVPGIESEVMTQDKVIKH